jgi:hypothetical protein
MKRLKRTLGLVALLCLAMTGTALANWPPHST